MDVMRQQQNKKKRKTTPHKTPEKEKEKEGDQGALSFSTTKLNTSDDKDKNVD